jgi:hypothetical protein
VVLFDMSSGKRTLETRLMKGVSGLGFGIMPVMESDEESFEYDCQGASEIGSGVSEASFVEIKSKSPLSGRGAGHIAVGCVAMNDMVGKRYKQISDMMEKL